MAKALTKDTDGDGEIDQWGMTQFKGWKSGAWIYSNGGKMIDVDKNGNYVFTVDNPANEEVLTKLYEWRTVLNLSKIWSNQNDFYKGTHASTLLSLPTDVSKLKFEFEFGIVPLPRNPKLDKHNLHTAFLNCNIRIIKATSEIEIYNESLYDIKGMKSGSFEQAGQDAITKAEEEIKNKIIPNIRKIKL